MRFDIRRVAEYVHSADSEELLDRVTVYRDGMEPAALDLMEGELDRRGVTRAAIAEFEAMRRETALTRTDGTIIRCLLCDRPATGRGRGWITIMGGRVPIFPWRFPYCDTHSRKEPQTEPTDESPS